MTDEDLIVEAINRLVDKIHAAGPDKVKEATRVFSAEWAALAQNAIDRVAQAAAIVYGIKELK